MSQAGQLHGGGFRPGCRPAGRAGNRVWTDRDAGAVVEHGDGVAGMDRDVDLVRAASHGLVDRVIDHLVNKVMQPACANIADIHGRAAAHRLQPAQHLYGRSIVMMTSGFCAHAE